LRAVSFPGEPLIGDSNCPICLAARDTLLVLDP
jgi:hypothetical protein